MAYNPIDVTTGKANTIDGPIWFKPGELTEEIDFTFDPSSAESVAAGWVRLGEGSTDGVESSQEMDSNEKRVWSKNLGTTFTNYRDMLTLRLASATDKDALKVIVGVNNVEDLAGAISGIRVSFRNRQPEVGAYLIQMKTDDGRNWWIIVRKGQADPNNTRSMGDENIIIMETVINALEDSTGETHYELIEGNYASTPVEPEPGV